MHAEKLVEAGKRQVFTPVRIHLSDGSHYDVTHPDQIVVTRRWSYVGVRHDGEEVFEDNSVIDNMHVTGIDPVGS